MAQARNERADRIGWIMQHQTAVLITAWLEHQRELMADASGVYPGGGSSDVGKVSGVGATVFVVADEHGPDERIPVTSVEAIVMRGEMMRDRREEVRDRLDGIITAINSLNDMLRRDLRNTGVLRKVPALCDGVAKGYEGHQLAWTPHSRDERNGWHSPSCRDAADESGLCPACLLRMNRWRSRNGLPMLRVNAAEVAA